MTIVVTTREATPMLLNFRVAQSYQNNIEQHSQVQSMEHKVNTGEAMLP